MIDYFRCKPKPDYEATDPCHLSISPTGISNSMYQVRLSRPRPLTDTQGYFGMNFKKKDFAGIRDSDLFVLLDPTMLGARY